MAGSLTDQHLRILGQIRNFWEIIREETQGDFTVHFLLDKAAKANRNDELVIKATDVDEWLRVYLSDLGLPEVDSDAVMVIDDISFNVDTPDLSTRIVVQEDGSWEVLPA